MSRYTATLRPLDGKYYGTIVEIGHPSGIYTGPLKIWLSSDTTPSRREIAAWDEEEHGEPWNLSDVASHFESATALRVAEAIVAAINGASDEDPVADSAPYSAGQDL